MVAGCHGIGGCAHGEGSSKCFEFAPIHHSIPAPGRVKDEIKCMVWLGRYARDELTCTESPCRLAGDGGDMHRGGMLPVLVCFVECR